MFGDCPGSRRAEVEIRKFAERVLLGECIEDKRIAPGRIVDRNPGPALRGELMPGRPKGLELHSQGRHRFSFPTVHDLDDDLMRGRALHFFANHELLALELMALVLLRFPDAPAAFRRTIVNTMTDEQRHMGLYLRRMKELGVQFGDISVNSFFWDGLSKVASPVEFVAQLSLVFEQANLDFSRYYAGLFAKIGDQKTHDILKEVYEDEIGHVRVGLTWFKRMGGVSEFGDEPASLFDSHRRHLRFPLNLGRAKGGVLFDDEGRRRAGLPDAYIERLRNHREPRGRPPRIHLYRVLVELPMARQLGPELELLPALCVPGDDVVLVKKMPSASFVADLVSTGFLSPRFIQIGAPEEVGISERDLGHRHCGELVPWRWDTEAADVLTRSLRGFDQTKIIAQGRVSLAYAEREEFLRVAAMSRFDDSVRSHPGRRAWRDAWLDKGENANESRPSDCEVRVILRVSFEIDRRGDVHSRRISRIVGDGDGEIVGGFVGGLAKVLPESVRAFVHGGGHEAHRLDRVLELATDSLADVLREAGLEGPVAFGAEIVGSPGLGLRMKVMTKIYCGRSLGHLLRSLSAHVAHGSVGIWGLVSGRGRTWNEMSLVMRGRLPVELQRSQGQKQKRIHQGVLCTQDLSIVIARPAVFSAFVVARNFPALDAAQPFVERLDRC